MFLVQLLIFWPKAHNSSFPPEEVIPFETGLENGYIWVYRYTYVYIAGCAKAQPKTLLMWIIEEGS